MLGVALAVSNRDAMATRADDPVVVEIASAEELNAPEKKDEPPLDLNLKPSDTKSAQSKPADSAAAEPAPKPLEKPAEKPADKPSKAESKPAAKPEKTAQGKPDSKSDGKPDNKQPPPQAQPESKPRVEASATPVPPPPAPEPTPAQAAPAEPQQWGSWIETAYSAMAMNVGHGLDSAEESAKLPPEEIAAFKARLHECWHPPAGLGSNLKVVLRVTFKRNGALAEEPSLLAASASPDGAVLLKTALQALQQCAPYAFLPRAKYKEWQMLDLAFSPSGLTALPRI
jgi:hypothetical protein